MKVGDTIQIERNQGGFVHIYARVLEVIGKDQVRALVDHPGNMAHEKVLLVDRQEVRTKEDLQQIAGKVNALVKGSHLQHGASETLIRQMGKEDPFWLQYLTIDDRNPGTRLHMHKHVATHYQAVLKRLS